MSILLIAYLIGCFLAYWIITRHMVDAMSDEFFPADAQTIAFTMAIQLFGTALSWIVVVMELRYEWRNWIKWLRKVFINIKLTIKFWWFHFFPISL